MAKRRITLTQKLFAYYFALCIATIITLSIYSYFTAKNALIDRTYEQLNSVKFEKQQNIERFFKERSEELSQIGNYSNWEVILRNADNWNEDKNTETRFKEIINSEYNLKIKKFFSGSSYYSSMMMKADGINVGLKITDSTTDGDVHSFEKFNLFDIQLFDTVGHADDILVVEPDSVNEIYMGKPIKKYNSEKIEGILLLKIKMEAINIIMHNTNKMNGLGETGEAYIIDADKLMRTTSRFINSTEKKIVVQTEGAEAALNNFSGRGQYKDYRNIDVLGAYGKLNIPGLHWAILAEIDLREAMIPIYNLRNSIIILSLIISILIFGIVFIISKRISQPVINLKTAADSISKGNYEIYVENNSNDEIGELSGAFNQMIDKIKEQKREIYEERSMRITSVFDGQEQERQRLARELHDGLGQRILAVKMQLERLENASPELKQKLVNDARTMLATISKEVVDMSENLMPHVLTEFGLISAIETLCEEVKAIRGIHISFHVNEIPSGCRDDVKIYLYRIIQEALNNIVKHSEAKNVDIGFYYKENKMNLSITDDGKGFDMNNIRKGSNGIYNMRDRVEILGGIFNIRSVPGKGTTVEVFVNIDKEV